MCFFVHIYHLPLYRFAHLAFDEIAEHNSKNAVNFYLAKQSATLKMQDKLNKLYIHTAPLSIFIYLNMCKIYKNIINLYKKKSGARAYLCVLSKFLVYQFLFVQDFAMLCFKNWGLTNLQKLDRIIVSLYSSIP